MRTLTLALVLTASVCSAQGLVIPHDPHPVPDFCASGGAVTGSETISQPTTPPSNLCVRSGATLTVSSALTVTTLLVNDGGTLILQPGASITFTDTAPTDAGQYGTGLIVAGTLRALGTEKTPFLRLAVEPAAGATTLTLVEPPVGWQAGDRLVVPDSRHMKSSEVTNWAPTSPQWETPTIASVDGAVVTLTAPLAYAHPGARDRVGAVRYLPHVGNLSRSITIRSEASAVTRGHTLWTGRADVDLRYVRFENLGRTTIATLNTTTNVAGRYPMHAHHLMGPATPTAPHQFTLIGNVVDGGDALHTRKWGLAIHDSHYGLIQGNVIYNMAGSAVMFEDGSESFNVVEGNFAVRSVGQGPRDAIGVEGGGFWFRGPNNYVRNNVAANLWGNNAEAAYGFKFFMVSLNTIRVPNSPGSDTNVAGQYTSQDGNKMPILQFEGNEVYGAAQGLTYWWVNSQAYPHNEANAAETVFKNTAIWHVFNIGVYHYPSDRITFDGLSILGNPVNSACCSRGYNGADYATSRLVFRNADVQGFTQHGLGLSTTMRGPAPHITIEDSHFANDRDIGLVTMWNVGGGQNLRARDILVRNSTFATWPGRSHLSIRKFWEYPAGRPASSFDLTLPDTLKVYKYQGSAADNFRVYYTYQATNDVAGGLAPAGTTTRSEITGLLEAIAPECSPVAATYTDWELSGDPPWEPAVCPVSEQQTRSELWTRTLLTEPSCGGVYLPTSEPRTGSRSCTYVPPTTNCTTLTAPVLNGVMLVQCDGPLPGVFTVPRP